MSGGGHEGVEMGYVLQGSALLTVGGTEYRIDEFDSVYFAASLPHRIVNIGRRQFKAVWSISPPHVDYLTSGKASNHRVRAADGESADGRSPRPDHQGKDQTMGKTITEKIFEAHLADEPFAGTKVLRLDVVMCHEITTPIAIADLESRKKDRVFDSSKIKAVIDHVTRPRTPRVRFRERSCASGPPAMGSRTSSTSGRTAYARPVVM